MNAPYFLSSNGHMHTADRPWWESRAAAVLLILAAAIPLLYPAIPPLMDVPGHMGRYKVELDLANSAELQRHFTFSWKIIGNLGVDLLILPIAKLVGLELATKLVVLAIPPLTVTGFIAVAREVHGRLPATALFALPLAYNHPFQFGFINFSLAMALCFLAFALWLRLARQRRYRLRAWLFGPIGLALFIVHAFGWASFCLLAFSSELVRNRSTSTWPAALLLAIKRCLLLALPLIPMLIWRGEGAGLHIEKWLDLPTKLVWLLYIFRDEWRWIDLGSAAVLYLLLATAAFRVDMRFSPVLGAGAFAFGLAFLLLPWKLLASAYADMRLAPYLVATAILAIRFTGPSAASARRFALLGAAFIAAILAARTASFAIAAQDQQRQIEAVEPLPKGARALSLVGRDCSEDWAIPRNAHLGSFVTIRREGFSNNQWVTPGMNLLGLREVPDGRFSHEPSQMVAPAQCVNAYRTSVDEALKQAPLEWFDYLWLIDAQPDDPALLRGLEPVWRSGGSALFRIPQRTRTG